MKRNLYSGGHRRPAPEAGFQQGAAASSRSTPRRQRTGLQRREAYPDTEEPSAGEPHSSSIDPSRYGDSFLNDAGLRIEAGRNQKAELKRLREEVLDIARELKTFQRREPGSDAAAAANAKPQGFRSGRSVTDTRPQHPTARRQRDMQDAAQMFGGPLQEFGRRPAEARPPLPGTKRSASIDPATNTAAPRAAVPPPIRPGKPLQRAPEKPKAPARIRSRGLGIAAKSALVAALMLVGTGLITLKLWGELPWLAPARQKVADMMVHVSWPISKSRAIQQADQDLTASIRQVPPTRAFAAPDTYGVYAVNDGQLTALEPLPIRVPDARVSISSTISKPAPASLASGRLSFVAYYRELATSVPEAASVRIVAKVMQATAFAGGKPKAMAVEDTWAVRGGAIDLRIAPVPGNQEMVVVRAADPNFTLSPGRYVLMFKNQAYDFSVAGTVSDTAQCLERSDLQDRSVFSECRELPAQTVNY